MYKRLWRSFCVAVLTVGATFAASIDFQVSDLGITPSGQAVRLSYTLRDIVLQQNNEVNIRFDSAVFQSLFNPVAGPGFSALVLQPNNPPPAFGDLSLLALINNPSLDGPFSVDAILIGSQSAPSSQPFTINELDASGGFIRTNLTGNANSTGDPTAIPEPSTFIVAAGLAMIACRAVSRHRRGLKRFEPPLNEG